MTKMSKRTTLLLTGLLAGGLLTGCIDSGVDDSDSYYDDSGDSQSSAGGSCGDYTDVVSGTERSEANSCGTQVSVYYAQADSALSAAIAHCQRGDSSGADNFYDEYKMVVELGRDVKAELCGGSVGGGFEDPSEQEYYNLCTTSEAQGGRVYYYTSCYGAFKQATTSCPTDRDYSYLNNHPSLNACSSAAAEWRERMAN